MQEGTKVIPKSKFERVKAKGDLVFVSELKVWNKLVVGVNGGFYGVPSVKSDIKLYVNYMGFHYFKHGEGYYRSEGEIGGYSVDQAVDGIRVDKQIKVSE